MEKTDKAEEVTGNNSLDWVIDCLENEEIDPVQSAIYQDAICEGAKEVRLRGREEGAKMRAIETARAMKADGMAVEIIAKYTGLSLAEIEELS